MPDRPQAIDASQRTAARVAALAYLIPIAFVVYANFGLREPLLVRSDMAESIRRVASAETFFRLSIAFDLVYCIGAVVLLAALYVLFRPISHYLVVLASALKLVYAMTAVLMALSYLAVVRLVTDAQYQQLLAPEALQALVRANWFAANPQYYVGLVFWSLSGTLFGWLWLKSRYIPKTLAVFGIVSAAWCVFCTFAYIIEPGFARVVNLWWFDSPFALFDITLSLWLLFKGLRNPIVPVVARPLVSAT